MPGRANAAVGSIGWDRAPPRHPRRRQHPRRRSPAHPSISASSINSLDGLYVVDYLGTFVKDFFVPGSTMFILVGLAVGAGLLSWRPATAVWGRRWLVVLVVAYLALSMPFTSDALFAGLNRGYRPLRSIAETRGARTIVVLGNGIQVRRAGGGSLDTLNLPSAYCALEAARLYHRLQDVTILASGGSYDGFSG